jgi:nitroreductase
VSDAERIGSACAPLVLKLIRERRSVRQFQEKPVSREILTRLIEAASFAPSAGNRQDWLFTVVASPEMKKRMADAVNARWRAIIEEHRDLGIIEEVERYAARFGDFAGAPAFVLVSCRAADAMQEQLLGPRVSAVSGSAASAAMAAQNLMLAAHALGLGTCCMTGALAASKELAELAGLGRRQEIVCLVALGYPAESPAAPDRKSVDEIARFLE